MLKIATPNDYREIAKLALLLWTDNELSELENEFRTILELDEDVVMLAYEQEEIIGFAQCQLRHDYVEGTEKSPVGYLEGIYVKENYREKGYAKLLLEQCEKWAKEKGCVEFASDCELGNLESLKFHLRVGFKEANRIICFTKKLCV